MGNEYMLIRGWIGWLHIGRKFSKPVWPVWNLRNYVGIVCDSSCCLTGAWFCVWPFNSSSLLSSHSCLQVNSCALFTVLNFWANMHALTRSCTPCLLDQDLPWLWLGLGCMCVYVLVGININWAIIVCIILALIYIFGFGSSRRNALM